MIISASRRTDIPAHYIPWFMNRLREGYVLVPNPHNSLHLSRINLAREAVDGVVFWTKNPAPALGMLPAMAERGYPFLFQFTLTPYGSRWEPGLPPKRELISTFRELARQWGPERVVWRYDPVILTEDMPVASHLERFAQLCAELHASTRRCVFSFFDAYRHVRGIAEADGAAMAAVAQGFARIAEKYGLPLFTCAENTDFSMFGVEHSACIGPDLEPLFGRALSRKKDSGQRSDCGCIAGADIGMYDTCCHGCVYCYANTGAGRVARRVMEHDPHSPMLSGHPTGKETVSDRKA